MKFKFWALLGQIRSLYDWINKSNAAHILSTKQRKTKESFSKISFIFSDSSREKRQNGLELNKSKPQVKQTSNPNEINDQRRGWPWSPWIFDGLKSWPKLLPNNYQFIITFGWPRLKVVCKGKICESVKISTVLNLWFPSFLSGLPIVSPWGLESSRGYLVSWDLQNQFDPQCQEIAYCRHSSFRAERKARRLRPLFCKFSEVKVNLPGV